MAMAGVLSRATYLSRTPAGTIIFVGTIARYWNPIGQVLSTLSFAGATARFVHFRRQVISKALLLQAGGWLKLQAGGPLLLVQAKVLSFSGVATRRITTLTQVSVAGVLNAAGVIARNLVQYRSLAGILTLSGTIARSLLGIQRGLASVLSFGATIARHTIIHRSMVAALALLGVVSRASTHCFRSIAGSLSFVGVLRKRLFVSIAAALSFAGALATVAGALYYRTMSGVLSCAATIARSTTQFRSVAAIITSFGVVSSAISQFIGGVIGFIGSAVRFTHYRRPLMGTMTMAAAISDIVKYMKTISGAIHFRGVSRRMAAFAKKGLSKLGFNLDAE